MAAWTADFRDVFDTVFGNDATGGGEEIVTLLLRDAGAEDGQTADETEMWAMGCCLYRPAPPDDDGKCQALVAQIGPRKIAIATRDSRASKVFGALNPGDAVFGSPTGGGMFRANGDGSVGFRKSGKDGAADSWVHIEKDGDIIVGNEAGQLELTKDNGFVVSLADGSYLQLGEGAFVVGAASTTIGGTCKIGGGPGLPVMMGTMSPATSLFAS